jgi:putative ABC transport system permease protein
MIRPFTAVALLLIVAAAPRSTTAQTAPPPVLISRQLASAEHLKVGDVVNFSSEPSGRGSRPFRIAGIYEPTPDPMRLAVRRHEARLHLPDLIELTADPSDPAAREAVTSINVALNDPREAAAFAKDAPSLIPVQGLIARTARGDSTTARLFVVLDRFHQAIALVTIVAGTTFLLALMLMLVDERRQTVGILRLIGIRQHRLLLQVLVEGLIVALAGAAFGIALAVVLQSAVNAFFQWRYDTALVFVRITPGIAVRCALIAVPLGVSASLVSSWALLRSGVLALAKR